MKKRTQIILGSIAGGSLLLFPTVIFPFSVVFATHSRSARWVTTGEIPAAVETGLLLFRVLTIAALVVPLVLGVIIAIDHFKTNG